jgi:hypothetical protein
MCVSLLDLLIFSYERGPNELGHLLGESIFDRLYRGPGERNRVSLCLASYFDCTGRMAGTGLLPMHENNW